MKKIAILGFGTVGGGIAEVIDTNREQIERQLGEEILIKYILDLRDFPGSKYEKNIIKDFDIILRDPEIEIVAEAMGGAHPAFDFSLSALKAGKSVVTSNKEVVANFGTQLLETAQKNGVRYLFEASVGGGIPIIRPLTDSLAGNKICAVTGILNGTTNYILSEMAENGKTFDTALKEAQEKGYAEKDPTADIDGIDAKRKICILAAIAFGKMYSEKEISTIGIRNIDLTDVNILKTIGAKIKLIGSAVDTGEGITINVQPCVTLHSHPLASVENVYNGILVRGNVLGDVMFYGSGAGKLPTASAVVSDIMDIFCNPSKKETLAFAYGSPEELRPEADMRGNYYIRTKQIPSPYHFETLTDGAYLIHNISLREIQSQFHDAITYKVL